MTLTDTEDICNNDNKDHTQVMFWSTAVCRPVRDIEVLRDLQVDPIVKKAIQLQINPVISITGVLTVNHQHL